jgi:hypothetical protein
MQSTSRHSPPGSAGGGATGAGLGPALRPVGLWWAPEAVGQRLKPRRSPCCCCCASVGGRRRGPAGPPAVAVEGCDRGGRRTAGRLGCSQPHKQRLSQRQRSSGAPWSGRSRFPPGNTGPASAPPATNGIRSRVGSVGALGGGAGGCGGAHSQRLWGGRTSLTRTCMMLCRLRKESVKPPPSELFRRMRSPCFTSAQETGKAICHGKERRDAGRASEGCPYAVPAESA